MATEDLLDLREKRESLEIKVSPVPGDPQELKVRKVTLVLPDSLDPMENKGLEESKESLENLEITERKETKAFREILGLQVRLVHRVLQESQDRLVHLESKAIPDHQGLKETLDRLDHPDYRAPPEIRAPLVQKEVQD